MAADLRTEPVGLCEKQSSFRICRKSLRIAVELKFLHYKYLNKRCRVGSIFRTQSGFFPTIRKYVINIMTRLWTGLTVIYNLHAKSRATVAMRRRLVVALGSRNRLWIDNNAPVKKIDKLAVVWQQFFPREIRVERWPLARRRVLDSDRYAGSRVDLCLL